MKKKKNRKWLWLIIFILISSGAIFVFRQPLQSALSELPVVGQFIEKPNKENKYTYKELENELKLKEENMKALDARVKKLQESNTLLEDKNKSLNQYEAMYLDFKMQKEKWDEEVAKTNPEEFIKQFERIYPETAEKVYRVLKGEEILSEEQKKLSKTIEEMDNEQAAKAIEILISTDVNLVKSIFNHMSIDKRGLILSAMTPAVAAEVIKLISPELDETLN